MLQDGADHFSAALEMIRHGLAVLIFTDLSHQFQMDTEIALGDLLNLGYGRYDKPQSYVLLLVNPVINKMLAALKNPAQLEISDTVYDAMLDAQYAATAPAGVTSRRGADKFWLRSILVDKADSSCKNAHQSTGPHDTTSTRFNAVKHGLLARGITELDDSDAYESLLQRLTELKCPVGDLENSLV
jgi:hypothetical protein